MSNLGHTSETLFFRRPCQVQPADLPRNQGWSGPSTAEMPSRELFLKIEKAKQEWEVTLDALPQLILLINQWGRVMRANRTLERWQLGKVVDVKNIHLHQLLHPHCHSRECQLNQLYRDALQNGAVEATYDDLILNRYVRVEIIPTSHSYFGFRSANQQYDQHFAVIIHDITEQQQAEVQLQQANAELTDSLRRRQEMCQTVSHELRAPLTLIQSYAQLLSEGTLGEITPEQREVVAMLVDKSQELQHLLERILH